MNRRDFLKGMAALGLVVPSTRFIFDMGKNAHLYRTETITFAADFGFRDVVHVVAFARRPDGSMITVELDGDSRIIEGLAPGRQCRIVTPDISNIPFDFTIESIQAKPRNPNEIALIDLAESDLEL